MASIDDIAWEPQPGPQAAYVNCPIFEVVYGGARGGGKTDGSLGEWAIHEAEYGKHAKGLFLRRTRVALEPTIMRAREIYSQMGADWQEQKSRFVFPSGAVLYFRYLDRDADADHYQGHDYTRVYVEELTQFPSPAPLDKLKATLRSASGVPVGFRATCNPGGPGHSWVKARYIDPGPWRIIKDVHGLERVFIPAKLQDNQFLGEQYVAALKTAGSEALVKAWLEGDWDVVEGAFFDCWQSSRHVLDPFEVPHEWTRFRSFDWGSASPFSVGWWAIASDTYSVNGVTIPRGALVRYREWYGASGPGVGLKMRVEDVADGIKMRDAKDRIVYSVADPAIFKQDGGPSIGEVMAGRGVIFTRADNSRVAGWAQVRSRLIGDDGGNPMMFVFSTCRDSIRTIPALPHDAVKPEDVDTDAEDHAADDWRYACMSRPWTPIPQEQPLPRRRYQDRSRAYSGGSWMAA